MAESGIYEIVNLVNGKRYVGSAKNFSIRWKAHRSGLGLGKHHNKPLQRAWNKYGADCFEFRVLELCALSDLINREQWYFDHEPCEYNCAPMAGSTLGYKFTPEARAKISASRMGQRKGVKQSAEHAEKRAAAHRGRKRSAETRAKLSAKAKGRPFIRFNDDYRRKLSEASKGRPADPKHIAAMVEARRNKGVSEEERAKHRANTKARWDDGTFTRERSEEYRTRIAETLRARSARPEVKDKLREQARSQWARMSPQERMAKMEKVRAGQRR